VFYLPSEDQYVPFREIRSAVDVRPVGSASDGALFRVSAKPGAPCTAQGAHPVRER